MEITEIRYVRNKETTPWRPINSRIYFWPEERALENLQNRRGRPYNVYKEFIPGILEKAQMGPFLFYHDVTARWSQKAGCGCGCSPGFILDGRLQSRDGIPGTYDIHVTIK